MGWQWGSIPVLMYGFGEAVVVFNFLLETDETPLLLTDNTGMLLAGS